MQIAEGGIDEGEIKMEGARQTQTRLSLAEDREGAEMVALPKQMGTMYGTTPTNADADERNSVTASLGFCPDSQLQKNLQMPEGSGPQTTRYPMHPTSELLGPLIIRAPVQPQSTPELPQAKPVLPPDAETEEHQAASLEFGIDSLTISLEFDSLTLQENGLMLDCLQEDCSSSTDKSLVPDCTEDSGASTGLRKRRPSLQASELADVVRVTLVRLFFLICHVRTGMLPEFSIFYSCLNLRPEFPCTATGAGLMRDGDSTTADSVYYHHNARVGEEKWQMSCKELTAAHPRPAKTPYFESDSD